MPDPQMPPVGLFPRRLGVSAATRLNLVREVSGGESTQRGPVGCPVRTAAPAARREHPAQTRANRTQCTRDPEGKNLRVLP